MAEYTKKLLPLFLSVGDEAKLSLELARPVPGIRLVDGAMWASASPPAVGSLADCLSSVVYLWDQRACPRLPFKPTGEGRVMGPTSGVVIQLTRSDHEGSVLTSGDAAIGYEKAELIASFVGAVWRVLRSLNAGTLKSVNPATGETLARRIKDYVVGPGAKELSRQGVLLKHCTANVFYKVE